MACIPLCRMDTTEAIPMDSLRTSQNDILLRTDEVCTNRIYCIFSHNAIRDRCNCVPAFDCHNRISVGSFLCTADIRRLCDTAYRNCDCRTAVFYYTETEKLIHLNLLCNLSCCVELPSCHSSMTFVSSVSSLCLTGHIRM